MAKTIIMKNKLANLGFALSREAQKKLVEGAIGDDGEGGSCSGLSIETCSASILQIKYI